MACAPLRSDVHPASLLDNSGGREGGGRQERDREEEERGLVGAPMQLA